MEEASSRAAVERLWAARNTALTWHVQTICVFQLWPVVMATSPTVKFALKTRGLVFAINRGVSVFELWLGNYADGWNSICLAFQSTWSSRKFRLVFRSWHERRRRGAGRDAAPFKSFQTRKKTLNRNCYFLRFLCLSNVGAATLMLRLATNARLWLHVCCDIGFVTIVRLSLYNWWQRYKYFVSLVNQHGLVNI